MQINTGDTFISVIMVLVNSLKNGNTSNVVTMETLHKIMSNLLGRGMWRHALALAFMLSRYPEYASICNMCFQHHSIALPLLIGNKKNGKENFNASKGMTEKYVVNILGLTGFKFSAK